MTLIEAMQQGCVPVAFKTFSSIIDIIDDGKNGYLVAPNDMHGFKDRSFLLANDGALRSESSQRGTESNEAGTEGDRTGSESSRSGTEGNGTGSEVYGT